MRRTSKIGLMIAAMMFGLTSSIMAQEVPVIDENSEVSSVEAQEIKATRETLEKANTAINNKDYQSAIVYLTAYLNYKQKKYEIYKLRGECFYALRQYGLAEKDFQTAIDLKTADDKFLTGTKVLGAVVLGADKQEQYQNTELGNLYGELMYAQKAQNNPAYEFSFKKAGEYNSHIYLPTPKKADINKINCPEKYGKVFNPQGIDATIYASIDDISNKKYRDAVFKIQEIISEYPKYYLGYYLSGVAMAGMEQDEDAIVAFNQALKYNPYDFESMASLGQIYYNRAEKTFSQDDIKKSLEYFEKALKYNKNCPTYSFYIGLNQMMSKDYEGAVSSFNNAISENQNDYGSMYYKAISQYVLGDYNSVIEGTTKLLYKRVSNYNSVLYLKALAEYKSGKTDDAISDLEKIHNLVDDIYSDEVKTRSKKDELLDTYLYYLKAQMLKNSGYGVVSDLHKAYQNPVIAALAKDEDVTFNMSYDEIENQYDYMQTTFADKNIKISYQDPDYKISTSKGLPQEVDSTVSIKNEVEEVEFVPQKEVQSLAQSPINEGILPSENEVSMAQMLAANALPSMKSNVEETPNNSHLQEDKEVLVSKPQEQIEAAPKEEEQQFIIIDEDTIVFTAPVQKPVESFEIKYDENNSQQIEDEKFEQPKVEVVENNSIKLVAPEIKDSSDFKISYLEDKPATASPEQSVNEVEDKILEEKPLIEVKEEKNEEVKPQIVQNQALPKIRDLKATIEDDEKSMEVPAIVEKHADVNLDEFSIPKNKVLNVNPDDEVIVFNPKTLSLPSVQKENLSTDFTKIKNRNIQQEEILASLDNSSEVEVQEPTELVVSKGVEIITEEKEEPSQVQEEVKDEPQMSLLEQEVKENVQKLTESDLLNVELPSFSTEDEVSHEEPVEEVKKHWFSRKSKATETEEQVSDTSSLSEFLSKNSESTVSETKKSKKIKKSKKDKNETVEDTETEAIEEIYNEPEQEETQVVEKKKFKLFGKKNKIETTQNLEGETTSSVEDTVQDLAEGANDEISQVTTEKKKRNWFKKKVKDEVSEIQEDEGSLLPLDEIKDTSLLEDINNDVDYSEGETSIDNQKKRLFNKKDGKSRSDVKKEKTSLWKRLFSRKVKTQTEDSIAE